MLQTDLIMSNFVSQTSISNYTSHQLAKLILEKPDVPINAQASIYVQISELTGDYDTIDLHFAHLNQYDDHIELYIKESI